MKLNYERRRRKREREENNCRKKGFRIEEQMFQEENDQKIKRKVRQK